MIRKKRKVCLYIHLPDTQFIRSVYPLSVCLSTYLAFRLSIYPKCIYLRRPAAAVRADSRFAAVPAVERRDGLLGHLRARLSRVLVPALEIQAKCLEIRNEKNFNSDEDPWSPAEKGRLPGRQGSLSAGSTPPTTRVGSVLSIISRDLDYKSCMISLQSGHFFDPFESQLLILSKRNFAHQEFIST